MTEETIDYFKYRALLAELEPLKGKKKPVHDFIKKLYELSNCFDSYNKDYKLQPETLRYAFMLAARALSYDGSARSVANVIKRKIDSASYRLVELDVVTPENTLETFEFWTTSVNFYPSNLEMLYRQLPIMEVLGEGRVYFSSYSLKEFKYYTSPNASCSVYLFNKFGPNVISTNYPVDSKDKEIVFKESQKLIETTQIILKDSHEHNCSSSEEHY